MFQELTEADFVSRLICEDRIAVLFKPPAPAPELQGEYPPRNDIAVRTNLIYRLAFTTDEENASPPSLYTSWSKLNVYNCKVFPAPFYQLCIVTFPKSVLVSAIDVVNLHSKQWTTFTHVTCGNVEGRPPTPYPILNESLRVERTLEVEGDVDLRVVFNEMIGADARKVAEKHVDSIVSDTPILTLPMQGTADGFWWASARHYSVCERHLVVYHIEDAVHLWKKYLYDLRSKIVDFILRCSYDERTSKVVKVLMYSSVEESEPANSQFQFNPANYSWIATHYRDFFNSVLDRLTTSFDIDLNNSTILYQFARDPWLLLTAKECLLPNNNLKTLLQSLKIIDSRDRAPIVFTVDENTDYLFRLRHLWTSSPVSIVDLDPTTWNIPAKKITSSIVHELRSNRKLRPSPYTPLMSVTVLLCEKNVYVFSSQVKGVMLVVDISSMPLLIGSEEVQRKQQELSRLFAQSDFPGPQRSFPTE